jgi:LmbE family N-acetylglucosaminyl deacetylase
MRRRLALRILRTCLTLALLATSARSAGGALPPLFPRARTLLWIAAHPDDEVLAAPLLGRLCVEEGVRCHFVVFTRGEAGRCAKPQGCGPDLGDTRAAEMQRAARLFHAGLTQWALPDGGGPAGLWESAAGGREALLTRLRRIVDATQADVALTFDPRHGSTCHGDHRQVGSLVLEAMAEQPNAPALYLLETVLERRAGLPMAFAPAAGVRAGVTGFDANSSRLAAAPPYWQFLLDAAAVHGSQFDGAQRRALRRMPSRQRVVYLAPAERVLASPVAGCE